MLCSAKVIPLGFPYTCELQQGAASRIPRGLLFPHLRSPDLDGPDKIGLGAAAGLAVVTLGIPVAVGMLGFKGAGIAAGSAAAKIMSAAAVANGGGVAAGGAVATLQSVGAAGLSVATKAAITAGGALLAAIPK